MCGYGFSSYRSNETGGRAVFFEKRAFGRIPASMPVHVLLGIVHHHGYALSLSENGMYIKTGIPLVRGLSFEVLIPSPEEVKVPVRAKRIGKSSDFYNGCGVVLLKQPKEFLDIVSTFRERLESKTRLQVSDEKLRKTTKCINNFACLIDEERNICSIERPIKAGGLFIRDKVCETCNYLMTFGFSSFICNCPTRNEIFERFRI